MKIQTKINLFTVLSAIMLASCSSGIEKRIRDDINARFVNPEIVELKQDSANVVEIINDIKLFKKDFEESKLKFDEITAKLSLGAVTPEQYNALKKEIANKIYLQAKKTASSEKVSKQPCYKVVFRVAKNEVKILNEEFYTVEAGTESNSIKLIRRPCNWDKFFEEQGYREFVSEAKSPNYCSKCGENYLSKAKLEASNEKTHSESKLLKLISSIPVVSAQNPFNWDYEIIGMVTGQSTTGTGVFSEFSSSFTDFFGAQSKTYNKKIKGGEDLCFTQLRIQAMDLGGNAVIATDIDYAEVGGEKGMLLVLYGWNSRSLKKYARNWL